MFPTYGLLKAAHLLAVIVWLGGMFFALVALRPAAMELPAAQRVPLMMSALGRFFTAVALAIGVILITGLSLWALAVGSAHGVGARFNAPLEWLIMAGLGIVMMLIFGHIRMALFRRLQRAVHAHDWPAGASALAGIRAAVALNLALGVLIVLVTVVGALS